VPSLELFLPLAKVDLDRRMVTGVATAEASDRSGEICDYASSKPYFERWSAEALKASGGKSLGAVRAMHGNVAAGKLTDIDFDDAGKRVLVTAKIVDDDEWRKVAEGVYTGFSQGGNYVKRWPDEETGLTRYTAEPHEISLVDLPCLPGATFEVVKGGVVEKRAFAAGEPSKDAASGVAMADGAYPIKTAEDVENAVGDYARTGKRPEVKAHILARAKAIGAEDALPDDWRAPQKAAAASLRPGLSEAVALTKAASALSDAAVRLERAANENAELHKAVSALSPALSDLSKRIAVLEAQPLPPRAALRAVRKSEDDEPGEGSDAAQRLAKLSPEARALALTKLSLTNPFRY
jgi:hypothetical protein